MVAAMHDMTGDMSFFPRSPWITPDQAKERLSALEGRMCPPYVSFPDYLETLQSNGQAQCTTVWTKLTVAYRCRTCQVNDSRTLVGPLLALFKEWTSKALREWLAIPGITPLWETIASAICQDCFLNGDHKKHDYVMYHSDSGGCCDCGDLEAWKVEGFCSAHRSVDHQERCVSSQLEPQTKESVSEVLSMLAFVSGYISGKKEGSPVIETALVLLDWLKKLCSVDALRKIVCSEVVQMTLKDRETQEIKAPLQVLLKTFASMPEEILEGETTLFLQMLYNPVFKQQYSEELMKQYQTMIESVVDKISMDGDHLIKHFKGLDSCLDRVMVQLFNVPNMDLIKRMDLLGLFVRVFGKILTSCHRRGTNVVDVTDPRIQNKVYLRPQGDLRLIVAHQSVAQYLLEEQRDVFRSILDVLASLQWMNPYCATKNVNFEEHTEWTLAIQLEMNTMAIVFQLVSRCYSIYSPELENSIEPSRNTLLSAAICTLDRLRDYLKEESTVNILSSTTSNTPVSLHIPLHRTLSAILAKLVLVPWKDTKGGFLSSLNLGYSEAEVLALMEHPLRITAWMAQIRANRWHDMSDDFSRLELIYRSSFWHDQSMDMDILLLQFCAVARENMEGAIFKRMAERFELMELVSSPLLEHEKLEEDKISLLQDFMRLVLLVVRERRNTGMTEEDCLRYDVIQWLCVKDQTYSQLCRALSAVPVDNQQLTEMLEKVALFHDPKVQERGYYQLKPEYWQEFDPLFSHFYANELEDAQERVVNIGKLPQYWRIRPSGGVQAPYNRLINLLHTEECHQLLWNVLNYVCALVMKDSTATASESLGVTALQMLALALQDRSENPERFPAVAETWELPLASSNDICHNINRKPQFNQITRVMDWGIYHAESPSILDLLRKLKNVKNAPRLVDSVHYVMDLLRACPYNSAFEGSPQHTELNLSPKSHARVYTTEDDEHLQKKQRQLAIMAQFKAKQNAFLEQFEDSDDDECMSPSYDGRKLESGNSSSTAFSSAGTGSEKATVEAFEVHECAFCRSECGGNDKSIGWIALVQRYNMPKHVIEQRKEVTSKEDAEKIVKRSHMTENGHSPSDADAKQLVVYMGESMIDHVPTEHVRCCGHQMHQECFQSYHDSLVRRHLGQTTYEGKSIIDLNMREFLCPICRRLANVLLPVVHRGSFSRTLQASMHCDLDNEKDHWEKFWNKFKNLPGALEQFAVQSLNVRSNFQKVEEVNYLSKCPVFWEVFASNITHCEVETREELPEVASASTASSQLSDQCVWGGDAGHWIAIRELGKLAIVSNTIDRGQEMATKREKMKTVLTKISPFLQKREHSIQNHYLRSLFTAVHDLFVKLQKSIEEIHNPEELKDSKMSDKACNDSREVESVDEPTANGYSNPISEFVNPDGQYRELPRWTASEPSSWASSESSRSEIFRARGVPAGVAPSVDLEANERRDIYTTRLEDLSDVYPTFSVEPQEIDYLSQPGPVQIDMEWSSTILNGSIFEADPFWLLIALLSAMPGWPKVEEVLLLVKFSYTVALTQALLACSRLQSNDDMLNLENAWGDVVQYTCLPFLRRAALLMQIITGEGFTQMYNGSGRKVMDTSYLQQELGLADCYKIFASYSGATVAGPSLLQQLRLDHNFLNKELTLMEVPKELHLANLPSVFQELLQRSIHDTCNECGKVPKRPAICLLCGIFFCYGSDCCAKDDVGECSRHAELEGSGIGIFLLMRSTQLVIIRGGRVCMAPSLYLDQHGEDALGERQDDSDSSDGPEDIFLRRSQLLNLSNLRLNEVRRLWLTAGFDHDTHILHNSQISPGTL